VLSERPSVRVLYMSGYTEKTIDQHGVLEPGLAFIQKPFSGGALIRKIREVLAADRPPLF
jgi:two-component system cell cycle sensor histidine kinase/response regulator CckA